MIINNLNIFRASYRPAKADTKLIIDSDTELAVSVALQCFQMVTRWNFKITYVFSDLKLPKFTQSNSFNIYKAKNPTSFCQSFSIPAFK